MPLVTELQVLDQLKARLQQDQSLPQPSFWVPIARQAAIRAEARTRALLASRGYTPAQVDKWEGAAAYALEMAVSMAFLRTAYGDSDAMRSCRDELKAIEEEIKDANFQMVDSGGVVVHPSNPPESGFGISAGRMTNVDEQLEDIADW